MEQRNDDQHNVASSFSSLSSIMGVLESFSSAFYWRSNGRKSGRGKSLLDTPEVEEFLTKVKTVTQTAQFVYGSLWFTWLIVGMLFYKNWLNLTWSKSFYMAVNVGYSVGWGDVKEDKTSKVFSAFFVLCGASFVAAALSFFAGSIVRDRKNWYTNALRKAKYENFMMENAGNFFARLHAWMEYHYLPLRAISLWLAFIVVAMASSWSLVGSFDMVDAFYFALSTASTGGLIALPAGTAEWKYGLTGLYGALSVPVMGLAMAMLASLFLHADDINDTIQAIRNPVNKTEVDMLTDFELANDDGVLDKAEFIILCMVRTGAATPELIRTVNDHFNALDRDKNGVLTLEELSKPLQSKASERSENYKLMVQRARSQAMGKREKAKRSASAKIVPIAEVDSESGISAPGSPCSPGGPVADGKLDALAGRINLNNISEKGLNTSDKGDDNGKGSRKDSKENSPRARRTSTSIYQKYLSFVGGSQPKDDCSPSALASEQDQKDVEKGADPAAAPL